MSNNEQRDELAEVIRGARKPWVTNTEHRGMETEQAAAILAAGYSKVDHIEYAADHKHAGLDITDEDGDLFTDLDGIKWLYEEYFSNVTLMQRTVGPWMPVEPNTEATR